jgi:hypothetical protein
LTCRWATLIDSYRIIRRRIVWLLGRWVGEDLTVLTRVKIYQVLVHLLKPGPATDTAIRLTAAHSLAKCDTWDFDADTFMPFVPEVMEHLTGLLSDVSLPESQMRVNEALGVIVERVGVEVRYERRWLHNTRVTGIWQEIL